MWDSITRKIALCVELKDAFTNKAVGTEDIRVCVNGSMPMLKKERRYYIFQGIQPEQIEVCVKAEYYEDRNCQIVTADYDNDKKIVGIPGGIFSFCCGIPMLTIHLYPNEKYKVPEGYVRKEYCVEPFQEIRVLKNTGGNLLLAENYDGGEWLPVMFSESEDVEGKWFRILEADKSEDFLLLEKDDENGYRLETELMHPYQKGCRIYELYCVRANARGRALAIFKED